jgi:ABC-2 type transport system permease protein
MVRFILKKEMLENLTSLRFVITFVLILSLFAMGAFVFVNKHQQRLHDYWTNMNRNHAAFNETSDKLYRTALYNQQVCSKPNVLTLCTEGFEKYIPNSFSFNAFSKTYPTHRGRMNDLLPGFFDLDWSFIVSLFLSFAILVLTYDSFSGEKQTGTLRLLLSGSIARHSVLLGKYMGVMVTIGLPLLVGLLTSLIIVSAFGRAPIGMTEWSKMLVIILLSFLYLSTFACLGMLVSSRTSHPLNSIVILLFVWIILVILIPGSGRVFAALSTKVPTQAEMRRNVNDFIQELAEGLISDEYGRNAYFSGPDRNDPLFNPTARAKYYTTRTNGINKMINEYIDKMIRQVEMGRMFTRISPAAIYQSACETIAGTGLKRFYNLSHQVADYQSDLKDFIHVSDSADPDSLHLLFDEELTAEWWKTISHDPVDFKAVPQFQERIPALGGALKGAIWDIGVLILFNLLFFGGAHVSFLMYDVV